MGARLRIAFQGEIGAYSEEAVLGLFPGAEVVPRPSFEKVFEAVESGEVDHGVVPIENSLHGSVHANYDLLREHELHITAELHLRIRHHLLAVEGVSLTDIRHVHSHPQALGQCRDFLKAHLPEAALVPAYDTAGAAKDIAAEQSATTAAIASASAAREYGLSVLASGIESNPNNYTRFLALSRDAETPPGHPADAETKTSVLYVPGHNIPGVLFKSLAVFALRDIDLFKIESRPLVGTPGKYIFYLDLAGSTGDETVANAIGHLEEIAAFVKVLGSYPAARIT
ncbi:MAG: prephenate dehydratase [Rhodothermales bacterium]|nr:prephenate dehydratase [Rhodothermales bacterium]